MARPTQDVSHSYPTPRRRYFAGQDCSSGVAQGSFGSVPVGIRISLSASEGPDEGPHDVDQLGDERIELGMPKLELKRSNDVSDVLIQIEEHGFGDITLRWCAMPASRSCQTRLSHTRLRDQCSGCWCSGGGERYGLCLGLVLPLGVVTVLTRQALPIHGRLHGGSRDDGLGAPRSADLAHVVRLLKRTRQPSN